MFAGLGEREFGFRISKEETRHMGNAALGQGSTSNRFHAVWNGYRLPEVSYAHSQVMTSLFRPNLDLIRLHLNFVGA